MDKLYRNMVVFDSTKILILKQFTTPWMYDIAKS